MKSQHPHCVLGVLGVLGVSSLGVLLAAAPASAQPPERGDAAQATEETETAAEDDAAEALREESSTRSGQVRIAGALIDYDATVGDIVVRDDDGKPRARMTFVSYTRRGVDPVSRPVTFAFNGGPGSASVWVHLGAFGPKRAELDAEGFPVGPPPGRLVDNEDSILDVTDLVFIDPAETGWSRPAPGVETAEFTGYTNDVESVGELIRHWVSRHGRWASPKFVAGESYGTTRSAGLAGFLQSRYGMHLNGVVLLSSVINWQTKVFNVGNDLPYPLILPTYTAAAWYHDKLGDRFASLEQALDAAREFALGEYASALMLGDRLAGERRAAVRRRLAELSGLDEDYLEDADLRVEIFQFTKELLREEGRTIGRLDARYTGVDRADTGERFDYDPSGAVFDAYYVSLLKDYLRRELGFDREALFRHSAGGEVRPWDYHETGRTQGYGTNAYANYAETLRAAMHENPYLHVLVLSGYYDMATPFFATDYTIDHLQLDPALRANVETVTFEAGHMMYVKRSELTRMRNAFVDFVARALRADGGATARRVLAR
jgi:carboxypeptidase C (cathepsin A)